MSATDHEDPAYWQALAMRWERKAMENAERARDAEAVEMLTRSALELAFKRGRASGRCCRCGGETMEANDG
jgi:hypothetical protein